MAAKGSAPVFLASNLSWFWAYNAVTKISGVPAWNPKLRALNFSSVNQKKKMTMVEATQILNAKDRKSVV